MKIRNQNKLMTTLLMMVLGILFIMLKGQVISIAMMVLGIMFIVQAVLHLSNKETVACIIKAVIGIVIIVFGLQFISLALYVMAAVLLIYGLIQLVEATKHKKSKSKSLAKLIKIAEPVVYVVIAACLLLNQGGTISWAFDIAGAFLIIEGVISLADCLNSK